MTQEHKVTILKGIVLMAIFATVVTGAWFASMSGGATPNRPKPAADDAPSNIPAIEEEPLDIIHFHIANDAESLKLSDILKSIVSPANGVAIVHFHLPGDPASEQLADILNIVRKKHGRRVQVVRISFEGHPVGLKTVGVSKLPHIMMIVGTRKVFEFQGLWTLQRVDKKVVEILHGLLKRVGKEWRPDVPGMSPQGR